MANNSTEPISCKENTEDIFKEELEQVNHAHLNGDKKEGMEVVMGRRKRS